LKEDLQSNNKESKEEDGNDDEGSKDGPEESQGEVAEETPSFIFC